MRLWLAVVSFVMADRSLLNTLGDEGPEYELYNHREDPLDQNNLTEQQPEVLEKLKAALEERLALARASPLPEADSTEGMSDEELQRPRSLGYIQ